jgi:hypothetical protein
MTDKTNIVAETRIERDHMKRWNARTSVAFTAPITHDEGFRVRTGHRVINLRTFRTARGALMTTASVSFDCDGMSMTMLFQDYSKTWASEAKPRVLEKDVRAQHEAVLRKLADIVGDVEAFYAPADAERAAREMVAA